MSDYITPIWQGFHFKWRRYPHRVSVLGSRFNNLVKQGKQVSFYHDQHLKIGNWPSGDASYDVPFGLITSNNFFIGMGRTQPLDLTSRFQEGCTECFEIKVPVSQLQAMGETPKIYKTKLPQIKIAVNGFTILPKGNDSGWHFGGIGIHVEKAWWVDTEHIAFQLNAFIRPAGSPEPLPHGNVERTNNKPWKSTDPCCYLMEVDYAVFLGQEDEMKVTDATVNHKVENRKVVEHFEQLEFKYNKKDYNFAFPVLSGFKLELDAAKVGAKNTGRYVRNMGAMIKDVHLDKRKGKLYCLAGYKFSNTIWDKKKFTAFPWNMETTLYISQIAVKDKCDISYHSVTGRTVSADDHVYSKRIVLPF